jgi:predicted RNase H-like nuclease
MIDIPIGLPHAGYRNCDIQARVWLGPSVFPGARRDIWRFTSQAAANEHYWDCEGMGMGISCQLLNIGKKIKEVDDIITSRRQRVLCETHPELIFWTQNGRNPLDKKKSAIGRKQRIAILKNMGFKNIEAMLERRSGTGIGRDDLIDACACAIAARDAKLTIGDTMRDAHGLRMEMHY